MTIPWFPDFVIQFRYRDYGRGAEPIYLIDIDGLYLLSPQPPLQVGTYEHRSDVVLWRATYIRKTP